MAINKVGSKGILDGSVAAADFGAGANTSDKLANTTVTNAKLANSSITASGTSIALGASGTLNNEFVEWQSVVVSDGSTVTTMVAGRGYFVNNTSAVGIVKLPASASIGDTIAIKDYAGNFGTNKLTIQRNSHKIQGDATDSTISTNRASVVLIYVDSTKGWLYVNEHNVADLQAASFIAATGGTVTTSGNFKIHTFTGDSNFVVSTVGNPLGSNTVSYMVVAGGGAAGGGGGGAGGFREGLGLNDSYTGSPLRAPTGVPVSATTYPVTVGGGGSAPGGASSSNSKGTNGSNSIFSTITSTGGGAGGSSGSGDQAPGNPGGSGGAAGRGPSPGSFTIGSGNTPPVSPSQGNNGGLGSGGGWASGGGGGATAAAVNSSPGSDGPGGADNGGVGGAGATTHITGSPVSYAGGGGGQDYRNPPGAGVSPSNGAGGLGGGGNANISDSAGEAGPGAATAGGANTGGGGGGGAYNPGQPAASYSKDGGKGIVVIRYKFQ